MSEEGKKYIILCDGSSVELAEKINALDTYKPISIGTGAYGWKIKTREYTQNLDAMKICVLMEKI
jgi:hypothetical protein